MSEEQLRAEFEVDAESLGFDLSRTKINHNVEPWDDYTKEETGHRWGGFLAGWQAALSSQSAKSVPEADEATTELRVVYEAARKFLRYNGVDKDKVNQALDELDEAIEAVKHIDGGYKDFPLEAASQVPTDDDRVRELEKAVWVLKQIANLDPKNSGLIGTAVFMAKEAIASMSSGEQG